MKKLFFIALTVCFCVGAMGQNAAHNLQPIQLNAPDLNRGETIMQAFSKRQSTREFSDRPLSLQDLSDLIWAANGINRPESGKRTAPSAMNRQDIKVYVCFEEGSYLYNEKNHSLEPLTSSDVRPLKAPVCLILVADKDTAYGAMDAGIVSQNISIFCAGTNIATVVRAGMNKDELRKALLLNDEQIPLLNHPVGYFK